LVDWNHIDEDYHVVRVECGSYDCAMVWKRIEYTSSYGL